MGAPPGGVGDDAGLGDESHSAVVSTLRLDSGKETGFERRNSCPPALNGGWVGRTSVPPPTHPL